MSWTTLPPVPMIQYCTLVYYSTLPTLHYAMAWYASNFDLYQLTVLYDESFLFLLLDSCSCIDLLFVQSP